MQQKNCSLLLIVFIFFVACLLPAQAEDADDRKQQKYFIRYKHGNQTIPVTVVLDYKKQTEYVINMNSRAPVKSVTLYDFKQRTIAYKDLTNRECFLGRLTNETLNHEREALDEVKDPLESKPKILSLDPHRPTLTPTEIRNMAGQKTAVFCRKLNTWLLMPSEEHRLQKRDVDETEERTFGHRGFHAVHYSHYGHETKRRHRNPSHITSRHLQRIKQNAAGNENRGHGVWQPRASVEEGAFPQSSHRSTHRVNLQNKNYDKPLNADVAISYEKRLPGSEAFHKSYSRIPYSSQRALGTDSFSRPQIHTQINTNAQHGVQSPHNFRKELSAVFENTDGEAAPNYSKPFALHYNTFSNVMPVGETNVLNSNVHFYPEVDSVYSDSQNLNSMASLSYPRPRLDAVKDLVLESSKRTEHESSDKNIPLMPYKLNEEPPYWDEKLPLYSPESQTFNLHPSVHQKVLTPNGLNLRKQGGRNIEIESSAEELLSHITNNDTKREPFTRFDEIPVSLEVPDVSTNVLEIPKITNAFENLEHPLVSGSVHSKDDDPISFESIHNFPNRYHNFTPNQYFDLYETSENNHNFEIPNSQTFQGHIPAQNFNENVSKNIEPSNIYETSSYHSKKLPSTAEPILATEKKPVSTSSYWSLKTDTSTPHIFSYNSNSEKSNFPETDLFAEHPDEKSKEKANRVLNFPNKINNENFEISYPLDSEVYTPSSLLVPNATIKEYISPDQMRFQNVLRIFKPDEIVIDVENIPTEQPPHTASSSPKIAFTTSKAPSRKPISDRRITENRRHEQTSGLTWRSRYFQSTRSPLKRSSSVLPPQGPNGVSYHVRKNTLPRNHLPNESHTFTHPQRNNNLRQLTFRKEVNVPHQFDNPFQVNQHGQLHPLPPGVSMHPRHPQAPYADIVGSNMVQSFHNENKSPRSFKPHRQRHHRKKDRASSDSTSCCGLSGNPSALSSCCRTGGPCYRGIRNRTHLPRTSCCSPTKSNQSEQPPQRRSGKPSGATPVRPQVRSTFTDDRDRCQKEKMCRTLYESTQQVMVCRKADIEGC